MKSFQKLLFPSLVVAVLAPVAPVAAAKQKAYQYLLRSTGWVRVENKRGLGNGTCWLWHLERRLAVTNAHVVWKRRGPGAVRVFFPQYRGNQVIRALSAYQVDEHGIPARVVLVDRRRDLALLQLEEVPDGVRALPLARCGPCKGDAVFGLGNSSVRDGLLWQFRRGKVLQGAYLDTFVNNWPLTTKTYSEEPQGGGLRLAAVIQTRYNFRPGDCGGPLINRCGRLVGVNQGFPKPGNGTAVHVDELRRFLKRVPRSPLENGDR